MVKEKLYIIYIVLTIIALILVIGFGVKSIPELFDKVSIPNGAPFSISINPSFIEEGQYTDYRGAPKKMDLEFTLVPNPKLNITYIELNEEGVVVDRKDKTSQTKYSKDIVWTKKQGQNSHIFYTSSSSVLSYSNSKSLTAKGYLWGCQNCFMGEDYPYVFTFSIVYSEDGGSKNIYPLRVELPIK